MSGMWQVRARPFIRYESSCSTRLLRSLQLRWAGRILPGMPREREAEAFLRIQEEVHRSQQRLTALILEVVALREQLQKRPPSGPSQTEDTEAPKLHSV